MSRGSWTITAVAIAAVLAGGCGGNDVSPFVGSWTQTQPSGATFLWVVEEAEDGYTAMVYTDQAEWCEGEPWWSEMAPNIIDDATMEYTGVTNQCFGGDEFENSFATGQLIYDPTTDTLRDVADPEDSHYQRDTSAKPSDLYPEADA